jgi:AcrR family transcriptional regulator
MIDPSQSNRDNDSADARTRILDAAARLVASGGVAALTTRAVATEAAVQAPTLYRLFGDKRGLLDAVAEHGLASFIAEKVAAPPQDDPVQELRDAWDAYVDFGLANPAVFAIMHEVGRAGPPSPAAMAGIGVLQARVARIAQAGRLRIPEARAVAQIHAAGTGVVATLLALPEAERDPELSMTTREAILAAMLSDATTATGTGLASFAIGLRARLGEAEVFSPGEALLLREMLDRLR